MVKYSPIIDQNSSCLQDLNLHKKTLIGLNVLYDPVWLLDHYSLVHGGWDTSDSMNPFSTQEKVIICLGWNYKK